MSALGGKATILSFTDEQARQAVLACFAGAITTFLERTLPRLPAAGSVQACLDETLLIAAKLPSGFQRDLQRVKPPLFRGIDLTIDSVDIMAHLLAGVRFRPEHIAMSDDLDATEKAYKLVTKEGIPFREAYRRIAVQYATTRSNDGDD